MTERIQSFNSPLLFHDGADDGNRTRVISLEGWSSTIELRLQKRLDYFILVRFK